MNNISLKKVILFVILLIVGYIVIDAIVHWDEAIEAFNRGFNDMNEINENRSKANLK
ncbi:MAG TPA: hypothetical protein VIG94_09950 [Faecalibacter sp.]